MSEALDEIQERSADVLVVCFDAPAVAGQYRQLIGLSVEVASDENRAAYQAYGLDRAPLWRVLNLRTVLKYVSLVRSGMRFRRTLGEEDRYQMGGDFVVDPEGRLRFVHRSLRPDDRPSVRALLDALPHR